MMNTNTVEEFLNNASRHYYNGTPIISDEQFDALAEATGYNKVGATSRENERSHYHRMYSLQKYYEDEGSDNPLKGIKDICRSPKLDGAAISILYVNHKLVWALTRGDGTVGRVITDKLLATKLVPHYLPDSLPSILQVTGEIAAPKSVENARNYAAGALNLGSVEEFKTRAVEFFAYDSFPHICSTYDAKLRALSKVGFNTVQDLDIDKIYPTDGIVFRVNSNAKFDELGATSKHPRGAYALKERQECVETVLLGVEWQVGKSGKVTPVGILEPVLCGDATVSRATLNNPGFIKALDLRVGDRVAIRRAGEIIPQIVHKVE